MADVAGPQVRPGAAPLAGAMGGGGQCGPSAAGPARHVCVIVCKCMQLCVYVCVLQGET